MKIIIDTTEIDSPDEFGELLRKYVIKDIDNGFPFYSNFELKDSAKRQSPNSPFYKFVESHMKYTSLNGEEIIESYDSYSVMHYVDGVFVACHWDGDGTLIVSDGNRAVVNYDCKKELGWTWIDKTGEK